MAEAVKAQGSCDCGCSIGRSGLIERRLMLCFGDAHDAKCNADRHLGRAAVLPVDDQRGKARRGVGGVHAHEVSIRITARGVVGRWRGWQPVSKVSMMIMRPPPQGEGGGGGGGGVVVARAASA